MAKNLPWINLVLTGCAISFLLFFISLNSFLGIIKTPTQLQSEPAKRISSGKPLGVYAGNITGGQISLGLVTEKAGHASLYLKEGDKYRRFGDDRGPMTVDRIHQVTLKGLSPETDYEVMICTNLDCEIQGEKAPDWYGVRLKDDRQVLPSNPLEVKEAILLANGAPLRLRTGAKLNIKDQEMALLFGSVKNESNEPWGETVLIRIRLRNESLSWGLKGRELSSQFSDQLITLFQVKQGWLIDLANALLFDNQAFFDLDEESLVALKAVLANGEETVLPEQPYGKMKDGPVEIRIIPQPEPSLTPSPKPLPEVTPTAKPTVSGSAPEPLEPLSTLEPKPTNLWGPKEVNE